MKLSFSAFVTLTYPIQLKKLNHFTKPFWSTKKRKTLGTLLGDNILLSPKQTFFRMMNWTRIKETFFFLCQHALLWCNKNWLPVNTLLEKIQKPCLTTLWVLTPYKRTFKVVTYTLKGEVTEMIYFARSKFLRNEIHEINFSFIWQVVFKLG